MLRTIPMASSSVLCIQGYYIVSSLAEATFRISLEMEGGSSSLLAKYITPIHEYGSWGWQNFSATFGPLNTTSILQLRMNLMTSQNDRGSYFGLDEMELQLGEACPEGEENESFFLECCFLLN